jgi:TyrR family helix-turn-helix protein
MIMPVDLPMTFKTTDMRSPSMVLVSGIIPLREAIESVERQLLERAYRQYQTTRQMAASLEVNASTIVRKAAKYGIAHQEIPKQEEV